MKIGIGFDDSLKPAAAGLYHEAFGAKLAPAMPNRESRLDVLTDAMDPSHGIAALDKGDLVGLAGFHTDVGSLTGNLTFGAARRRLGLLRALRAYVVLALMDRKPQVDEMLMDGIVVRADRRGRGIGTALFELLESHARSLGKTSIRLDVIDTNPGAHRLYLRLGFEETKTERVPFLRPLMGFGAVTTMVKRLD